MFGTAYDKGWMAFRGSEQHSVDAWAAYATDGCAPKDTLNFTYNFFAQPNPPAPGRIIVRIQGADHLASCNARQDTDHHQKLRAHVHPAPY
jgi:hypothetical protein